MAGIISMVGIISVAVQSPASFWRENLIAVVILLRVLARYRSGVNKLSNIRSFIILLSGEGLTPFSINNRPSVFGEKKMKLSRVSFCGNTRKNFKFLVLVRVLVNSVP